MLTQAKQEQEQEHLRAFISTIAPRHTTQLVLLPSRPCLLFTATPSVHSHVLSSRHPFSSWPPFYFTALLRQLLITFSFQLTTTKHNHQAFVFFWIGKDTLIVTLALAWRFWEHSRLFGFHSFLVSAFCFLLCTLVITTSLFGTRTFAFFHHCNCNWLSLSYVL
jgi:hypothetical protein